jgi:hypothetical protein
MSTSNITEKELHHLSNLIFLADSANDAVREAVKKYKEEYGLDPATLISFVKNKFSDGKKHEATLNKHQQYVELDEQFNNI